MFKEFLKEFIKVLFNRKQEKGENFSCVNGVSPEGITVLHKLEGYVPYVYNDAVSKKSPDHKIKLKDYPKFKRVKGKTKAGGFATVYFGHLLTNKELVEGKYAKGNSRAEGEKVFKEDLAYFERKINELVKVDLLQHQYDALVSYTYNTGITSFKKSKCLTYLNKGEFDLACKEMDINTTNGKFSKGLEKRRVIERDIFSNGYGVR